MLTKLLHSVFLIMIINLTNLLCGYAQPYYFRHYQVENGLSNNTVFASIQDKAGFLWFGTKEGLNRFDGYQFKLYKIHHQQKDWAERELIYCLYNDPAGRLWVGTHKGLYWFDDKQDKLIPFHIELLEVNAVQADSSGRLWIIAGTMLYRYTPSSKTMDEYPGTTYFDAEAVCLDNNNRIWFAGTDGRLYRYEEATDNFTSFNINDKSPPFLSCNIQKILPGADDAIYIATSCQGIKEFNTITGTYQDILVYNDDKTPVYVRDILKYSVDEFWFATESGIFILDRGSGKFTQIRKKFLDPYSLNDNAVYTLCKDREGGVWAGTYFGGVNYYTRQYATFKKYFADNRDSSLHGSAVREIKKDADGFIWIGTEDAGLNRLDPRTGNTTHFTPDGKRGSISYSNIHGLLIAGDEVWIGTHEHGLDIMDRKTGKVIRHVNEGVGPHNLKNNFVVSMLQTSDGTIFIGTGNSLHRYHPESKTFSRCKEIPDYIFISSLEEASDKTIWIGTHGNGIFFYNPVTGSHGKLEDIIEFDLLKTAKTINSVMVDSKQNIWFGTEGGGTIRLSADRKQISNFSTKEGLPSNFIFKIIEDHDNRIWLTSSKGLIMIDQQQRIKVYTQSTGLLNDQFNYNSGFCDDTGVLYFGSVKGLISFKPDECASTDYTPPIYITDFQIQQSGLGDPIAMKPDKAITHTSEISLTHDQSSFSVNFAALSFVSPDMTQYRYMLEGLDDEWNGLTTNRRVYYTDLSPGTYIFRVKAALNGEWTEEEARLTIRILPPVWRSWWAYLSYATVSLGIIIYLIHFIIQRAKEKKEREIYAAKIDFFTAVAHEIRTPLTLIKGPVENITEKIQDYPAISHDIITLERNTDRLISLASGVLDFRKTETKGFSLNFTRVNLSAMLEEHYLDFKHLALKRRLEYTIYTGEDICVLNADEDGLSKILSNLFSNAVKYADKKVQVRLIRNDISVRIYFASDGYRVPAQLKDKVFEPFFRLRETSQQKGTGIGLALSKSLAELHGGRLYLDTEDPSCNLFVLELPLPAEKKKYDKSNSKNEQIK
ncbi:MAG: sensor histidine kinase [Chitinophagaceae bacterium]|nr:MAG: sensor histidine kinase [Chitinophagaceae bacterium]